MTKLAKISLKKLILIGIIAGLFLPILHTHAEAEPDHRQDCQICNSQGTVISASSSDIQDAVIFSSAKILLPVSHPPYTAFTAESSPRAPPLSS